ncbi:MAG TPA: amidohydrolase family protein [Burkholderiales bacterium]|nr:amidohydrolase family protein [Burkholderiales bacterium]
MRVIDFRLRPPMAGFLGMVMYAQIDRTARMAGGLGMPLAPSVRERSPEKMIGEMDTAGVRYGVVPGRISPVLGTIEAEDIHSIVARYPDRLFAYVGIDPVDRRKAVAAIDKAMTRGAKGVVIEPGLSSNPMHLDDARMYPIYSHCEDRKVPVLFMAGGNAGPDITYTSPEHIDRVARDFPQLRIISGHGNWPWVAEIIHVCYRRPNIWLSPDMYIFGGMPGALDYVNAANGFLADRFLFGTAYPLLPFKDAVDAFLRFPLKESVIDRVLYKNAADLLGLPG